MEQLFYKICLENGRVLGPIDIDRITLFVANGIFKGIETARVYPDGEWKNIAEYSELAALLKAKEEGRLTLEPQKIEESKAILAEMASLAEVDSMAFDEPEDSFHEEKTVIVRRDGSGEESTVIRPASEAPRQKAVQEEHAIERVFEADARHKVDVEGDMPANTWISTEKTAMFTLNRSATIIKKGVSKRVKLLVAGVAAVVVALLLNPESDKRPLDDTRPFEVKMPVPGKQDVHQSEKLLSTARQYYVQDTVDGYRKAAKILQKAVALDTENVKAFCLLASSYLGLIDVVNKDENYFTVVTRLIEAARAKGVDLPEVVSSDVELYLVLGNPDAAIGRIDEYTKTHQYGAEMRYYIAVAFFAKGDLENTLKFLGQIDIKEWNGARIPYLYGLLFKKTAQRDEAIKAFSEAVRRSPAHVKARSHLMELQYAKDNIAEAGIHADYVVANPALASGPELAKAHYFRSRMRTGAKRDEEALADLEAALKIAPEEPDYLLEYYTLKARLGHAVKGAEKKAKMFDALASGEKALREDKLKEAQFFFLSARQAQENDPVPLVKLSETFRRQGDVQSAKLNLVKAVKLAPARVDLYPKYIRVLIDAYEFEEAQRQLQVYKGLSAPAVAIDRLNGDLFFKQQRLREAQVYYKRAISGTNADSGSYVTYASILFAGNAFRDSAFFYGLALRFDPMNVGATIGVAKSLAELDGTQRGIDYLNAAMRASTRKAELMNGIGEIFVRKGDYSSALKAVDQALAYDSELALPYKTRGDAYAGLDKYKEALDAYLTYTNLAPLDPAGHIERYKLFLKKLDLKAAKESIEKVITMYPRYPGAYNLLGELYLEAQNFASAGEAAKQEMIFNPTYLPAYVLAGKVFILKRDYNGAIVVLNRALRLDPNFVPALIQAGDASRLLRTYGAAQALLERASSLDSGNPQIHKRLGQLYIDLGDKAKARQHYRAYLDLQPDAQDRAEVERYLGGG